MKTLDISNIRINDKFLINAREKNTEFLLELSPERFLYNWYRTSGITPLVQGYENSWERTSGINFRGHMFGHYMSALAISYNAACDADIKDRLYKKICECINGLEKARDSYQRLYPKRHGYIAPFGEYWLNRMDNVDGGDEKWNRQREGEGETYVPWYNLHKVIKGLLDIYTYTASQSALALVCGFADYIYRCRVSKYTSGQKNKMLKVEYGGMAEALYELYDITGKPEYRICADGFIENDLFSELANGNDVLAGRHANTTIPKVIGALKKYTVLNESTKLSDNEKKELEMYYRAAVNFFDMVTEGHSYVTGGNSVNEHFKKPNTVSEYYQDSETQETCNEYNMLKLAKELFLLTKDKKYADYYEKAYINVILAAQNPKTGEMTYFQPMGTGYSKTFNKYRFWCCAGTGIESHAKHGEFACCTDTDGVYINLYISSMLRCDGMLVDVCSGIGTGDTVKITVKEGGGRLFLRVPQWVGGMPGLIVNGKKTEYGIAGGYIALDASRGDEIELILPMRIKAERLKDDADIAAFLYGPFVLCARLGDKNVGECEEAGIMVLRSVKDKKLPDSIYITDASAEKWLADIDKNLIRTDKKEISFELRNTENDMEFVPYYKVFEERYGIYWRIAVKNSQKYLI